MAELDLTPLRPLQDELNEHPIYDSLRTVEDLRIFMEHHVFSVWDFMSLIKYLQGRIAPIRVPWAPPDNPELGYFINHLVLEEESDTAPGPDGEPIFGSHFEHYCKAMTEVGGDSDLPMRFLSKVEAEGVDAALYSDLVPIPARYFAETTFGLIREDKPHAVAAALALARERVIPDMFRHFLREIGVGEARAPAFHYYLKRHIQLDGDLHGALSLRLLKHLCGGESAKIEEAETAAEEAICARIRLWDGVLEAIETNRAC